MTKKQNLTLLSIALTVIFISATLFFQGITSIKENQSVTPSPSASQILGEQSSHATSEGILSQSYKVTDVVDGDTIEIEYLGEKKKLRLIGVNTPETVDPRRPVQCYGKEASDETKRILIGNNISLEKDISETDKYGRLLRYVYLKLDDGTLLFVNDYLVRQGFAQASTYPPDVKYADRFLQAQSEAQNNKRGLWGKCS